VKVHTYLTDILSLVFLLLLFPVLPVILNTHLDYLWEMDSTGVDGVQPLSIQPPAAEETQDPSPSSIGGDLHYMYT